MTWEKDIVLVHFEDQPIAFARIETITPDVKKGWYHVKLLLLQLPLQTVTWIIRDSYIDGETFRMGGKKVRLDLVECPDEPLEEKEGEEREDAKVISFAEHKKNGPETE